MEDKLEKELRIFLDRLPDSNLSENKIVYYMREAKKMYFYEKLSERKEYLENLKKKVQKEILFKI